MPAIGTYKKYQKKKEIVDIPQWQKVFEQVMAEDVAATKKPVRWNFIKDNEGLMNLSLTLMPIFRKAMALQGKDPVKINRGKISERDYISGFDEIAKGIETGAMDLTTSVGELLFMGTDLLSNRDFATKFQEIMDKRRPDEPETWRGDLTALMVQFGVPATMITKIGSRAKSVNRIKKLMDKVLGPSKASKIAQRVVRDASIIGATDFIASNEGRRIPSMFMEMESTEGLSGRKKAATMFRNKVRYGTEGTIIGGLFPLVGKGAQLLYKGVGRPVGGTALSLGFQGLGKIGSGASYLLARTPGVSQAGQAIAKATNISTAFALKRMVAPFVGRTFKQMPKFTEWRMKSVTSPSKYDRRLKRIDNVLSWFRAFGKMPRDIEGVGEKVMLEIKARARILDGLMEGLENRVYKLAKGYEKRYNTSKTSEAYEKMLLDDTVDYLRGTLSKNRPLPKEILPLAAKIRTTLNEILTQFGKNLPKNSRNEVVADLKKALTGNVNSYLVKSFATFTNPKYTPDLLIRNNARNWILKNVVMRNRDMRESAIASFKKFNPAQAYEKYADTIINDILARGKVAGKNPIKQLQDIGTLDLRDTSYKFLKTGEELPNVIRKLLGEQKDLRSQVLTTAADAVSSATTKMGYDMIAEIGLKNGWLFRSKEMARPRYTLAEPITKLKGIGGLNSKLEGLYTSPEFVQMFRGSPNVLDRMIQAQIWKQALQLKVGVQIGKTLYSPQTQIRNVTSASFFALWNGHVGHAASVGDSFRMVMRDIFKRGKGGTLDEIEFNEYVEKLIRLGVWDENVVASELRAVLKNIQEGKIKTDDDFFEWMVKKFPTEKVARLYAGGDNLWKQYGFEFFKSDLSAALKNVNDIEKWFKLHGQPFLRKNFITGEVKGFDEALEEASAYMLRNTYPTYSKVPPAIQELRKIPFFGNFVSFSSEMLRTGTTSTAMSLRHIASDNPALRQMGYKQLMGAYLAVHGIGKGLSSLSYYLTGSRREEWDAYQRSAAAPWDQNSQLYAITGWENGKAAAINFSYFSPYDVLERPIQAALTMAAKKKLSPEDTENYVLSLMFDPQGSLAEFLSPFLSPAIGYERFVDVSVGQFGPLSGRGGRTAEGSIIYNPDDSMEDKFNKSLVHILKGANPGVIASGMKLHGAIKGDVTGAGNLMRVGDELLALFTGTRIIRIDAKKDLRWLTSEMLRANRAADETTKFYKTKGYMDRPPSIMVDEFNEMQEKAFRIQKDFYIKLKDLQMLDIDEDTIRKILKKGGSTTKMINNLMEGEFTPISFSEPRFKTKISNLEEVADEKTEKSKTTGYYVDEEFVFPKDELKDVIDEWKDIEFFPETYNKETGQMEGGYNPEEASYMRDEQGKIIRDEYGRIKEEPTFLEKVVPPAKEFLKEKISPVGDVMGKAPTPPLPQTPMPDKKLAAATQINPATQLTRTETALLSPSEQAIRQGQRGTT